MGIKTRTLALMVLGLTALSVSISGCVEKGVPDPKLASKAYADALRRSDVAALYAMLDAESRRAISRAELARLVKNSKGELRARAESFGAEGLRVEALAEVGFSDGEVALLALEDGRFRIQAAGALPSGARTPIDALAELRAVLARRSYAGLVRVLSSDSRAALEQQLRDLVQALEQPETLQIELNGDEATINAPGGHRVLLKREDGVWKVHDFE